MAPFNPVKRKELAVVGLGSAPQVREESISVGRNYFVEIQTLEVKEADISMIFNTYYAKCSSIVVGKTCAKLYKKKTV